MAGAYTFLDAPAIPAPHFSLPVLNLTYFAQLYTALVGVRISDKQNQDKHLIDSEPL